VGGEASGLDRNFRCIQGEGLSDFEATLPRRHPERHLTTCTGREPASHRSEPGAVWQQVLVAAHDKGPVRAVDHRRRTGLNVEHIGESLIVDADVLDPVWM